MRKYTARYFVLCFVLCFVLGVSVVYGDFYFEEKNHVDGYYYGGVNNPPADSVREVWISSDSKKMASISKDFITIIDRTANKFIYVNKKAKVYAETTLPFKINGILEKKMADYLKGVQYVGTVTETKKTKKIGKFNCKAFESNAYILFDGDKHRERDAVLWVTTGVPFDIKSFNEMERELFVLNNFSKDFIAQTEKMKGLIVLGELYFYPKGFKVKNTLTITGITKKDPPPGIYSVPKGMTKKETLTYKEFRGN